MKINVFETILKGKVEIKSQRINHENFGPGLTFSNIYEISSRIFPL